MKDEDSYRSEEGQDSFENAKILVGYMEFHAKTPRAVVLFKHFVWLVYIAGRSIAGITKEELSERQYLSLHAYPGIVNEARTQLSKGLVPENWLELFYKEIDSASL